MVKLEKISILIIFHDEEKALGKTLEAVFSMDYPKNLIELVCVDDGSIDRSSLIAEKYPVKLIKQKCKGISFSRNVGLNQCTGEYVFFLDAHVYLKNPNTFKLINEYFSKYKNIGGICGAYHSALESDRNFIRDLRRIAIFKKDKHQKIITLKEFTTFSIAIGAFRKHLFRKIKFPCDFNNSYGEDVFIQILIHNEGYNFLYLPEIIGIHDARINSLKIIKKMMFEVRATGNIILNIDLSGGVRVPQLYFFLNYPITLVVLFIPCFFSFNFFIFPFVLICFLELSPALKIFFVPKYSISKKIVTLLYLFAIEIIQAIYLPVYLLVRIRRINQIINTMKIICFWEIKKFRNLVDFTEKYAFSFFRYQFKDKINYFKEHN